MKRASNLDFVGPTVGDDVRRIITRYGVDAVREAVKQHTKRRRGRAPEKDWSQMMEMLREDAHHWINRRKPFRRSARSIAKNFAENFPGQSPESTFRRIMRKLSASRHYFTLIEAESLSKLHYPYADYLRVLRALVRSRGKPWDEYLRHAKGCINDYERKFGMPTQSMTMQEIEAGSAKALTLSRRAKFSNVLQVLLSEQTD